MPQPQTAVSTSLQSARENSARKPIAFLTMDQLGDFVAYDQLAVPPLNELGWQIEEVSWRNASVDWNRFAAVVIRTPWDYHHDLESFLAVIDRIEISSAKLVNPATIVHWNIDKRYLREIESHGLPIVPTLWLHSPTQPHIADAFQKFGCDELVIKPTMGAGARDTFRLKQGEEMSERLSLYRNRNAMVQPFLTSIVEQGEWSLFYFGGSYSHTVLKTPKTGDFRVQEEYGSRLQAVEPSPAMREIGDRAIHCMGQTLVYARVDLVLAHDAPCIIELELIEPSLYFPYEAESPKRFALALNEFMQASEPA